MLSLYLIKLICQTVFSSQNINIYIYIKQINRFTYDYQAHMQLLFNIIK